MGRWHLALIPTLRRQRRVGPCEFKSGLQSEFHPVHKLLLERPKEEKRRGDAREMKRLFNRRPLESAYGI